jgi:DNA topoisomerase-2
MAPPKESKDGIQNKYRKMEHRQHVLERPGMYIGSIEKDVADVWVLSGSSSSSSFSSDTVSIASSESSKDSKESKGSKKESKKETKEREKGGDQLKMEKRKIEYIPGLFKIFDEIVANAIDHYIRQSSTTRPVKAIKVTIDRETGVISVWNDGEGIEIVEHPEHKIWVPELIFGNLLTSTNYDEHEEKTVQGTNGIGCKACNIFSTWFELETVDIGRNLIYKQRFEDNMKTIGKPSVRKTAVKKPYTEIRFLPDYKRFGLPKGLSDDMFEVMRKRVYDACAVTNKDVAIWFNDQKLPITSFQSYVDLYLGPKADHTRVYEQINDRWEVCASYNDFGGFEQISFVNGLLTIKGGKHVDYIVGQIVKKVTELLAKKHKGLTVKPNMIKDNLILFLKTTIVNPTFDSQSKETLTTTVAKFGSKAEVSDAFVTKLFKSGLEDKIVSLSVIADEKANKKTDGKKSSTIRGIPKLEDASWAGTAKSQQCTLILTEGDSAATMALSGLVEVGREKYGVFPLKGKIMNVLDATLKKVADNDEITNLKKIIGLETGKSYAAGTGDLRYGKIMLMTDADADGSHIKGLLFNLFNSMWPSLVKQPFMTSMLTPIVKAKKGTGSAAQVVSFYNLPDYEDWKKKKGDVESGWKIKYYKGLGTSTTAEAKEYFKDMHAVTYKFNGAKSEESFDLAFNKKKADDRKAWLGRYDRKLILDYKEKEVKYEDFVNKELIHFSNYDLERSIPNVCDGLKISQRKIMFSCFKRNLTEEIRVAQLAGYVSEVSGYHHGEASLQAAIVGLAQDFVGSNNMNILEPVGQFGGRAHGGKDASQPRYIYTLLAPATPLLFNSKDADLLEYLDDDGIPVEPLHYIPIIPLILVNGALGIGTGFSTSIPCYNPEDLIGWLRGRLSSSSSSSSSSKKEKEKTGLKPWYRGFKGQIRELNPGKFVSVGVWHVDPKSPTITITELPVGTWTFDYKEDLDKLLDEREDFKKFENLSSEDIKIVLTFSTLAARNGYLEIDEKTGLSKLESVFKLVSPKGLTTSNMYAFNSKGQITKYETPEAILEDFYAVRLDFYRRRKALQLQNLQKHIDFLENKRRFIKAVVSEQVKVHNMKLSELNDYLSHAKPKPYDLHEGKYDYLTRIPIYNFTKDKVDELEKEVKETKGEAEVLTKKTGEDLWTADLDALSLLLHKKELKEAKEKKKEKVSSGKGLTKGSSKDLKKETKNNINKKKGGGEYESDEDAEGSDASDDDSDS